MNLTELELYESAIIESINGSCKSAMRLMEYGFIEGSHVMIMNKSAFKGPIVVALRGALIALRQTEAKCITVIKKQIN